MVKGTVLSRLEGHEEEVLNVQTCYFRNSAYYVSASQDGYIFKWEMEPDWCTLRKKTRLEDGETCMVFTISFVPNTGNKYFIAACDDRIKLFDFEVGKVFFPSFSC